MSERDKAQWWEMACGLTADTDQYVSFVRGETFIRSEDEATQPLRLTAMCSDTFAYACADAEEIPDELVHEVVAIHKTHGYNGIIAWIAKRRGYEPLEAWIKMVPKYPSIRAALEGP